MSWIDNVNHGIRVESQKDLSLELSNALGNIAALESKTQEEVLAILISTMNSKFGTAYNDISNFTKDTTKNLLSSSKEYLNELLQKNGNS